MMKGTTIVLALMIIPCSPQPLDRLIDSLLMPSIFDPFDNLLHRVAEVQPHNPSDEVAFTGAVVDSSKSMSELPMGGFGGPKLPLMSPLSDLLGLSSLFDASGFLESLLGDLHSFEVPNVTLSGAECLITVDLRDLDVNNTSFKVYGSKVNGISVEISTVKETRAADEDDGSENDTGETDITKAAFRLRGASSYSAFTTIRSFPTPDGCEISPDKSKATISAHTNQLLIKLPKTSDSEEASEGGVGDGAKVVHASQALSEVPQEDGEVILRSALGVDKPVPSRSWFARIFGDVPAAKAENLVSNHKVQVPLVKYDEF